MPVQCYYLFKTQSPLSHKILCDVVVYYFYFPKEFRLVIPYRCKAYYTDSRVTRFTYSLCYLSLSLYDLYKWHGYQSIDPHEAGGKSGSTGFRNWCWFKLLASDTG